MKKIVSLLLVFAISFSIIAGLTVTSNAATSHTQSEAVSWAKSKVGVKTGDGQCVALIKAYYTYLGVSSVTGNGCDYATNSLPSGWSRIKYYSGFSAQPGDIAVWTWNKWAENYGHVAIVTSANSSSMSYIDQGKTYGYVGHSGSLAYNAANWTFYGVIRPDFKSTIVTPSKTPENLGDNFYAFIIKKNSWKHLAAENGNVQIASSGNDSSNPKQIWHFIRQSNATYKIVNEYDSRCMEAVNYGTSNGTNIATYIDNGSTAQRWYIYKNSNGYNLSPSYSSLVIDANGGKDTGGTNIQLWPVNNADSQRFSIYKLTEDGVNYSKPSKPSVTQPTVSVSNKTVNITWNTSKTINKYDSRVYDIRIYKGSTSGEPIFSKFNITTTKYTYTASDSGTYYVTLAAVNTKYYAWYNISSAVSFKISASTSCSHSYTNTVISAATCTTNGTRKYTCSKCGYYYTSSIAALGHNMVKKISPATVNNNGTSYTGYITKSCTRCSAFESEHIVAVDIVKLSTERYVYNSAVKTPSVKVVDFDGKVLKKGTDYTLTYASGRKNVGKYAVKVNFKGNYTGSRTLYFKILPKGTALSKLTAGKKSFTVKWKKQATQTSAYQLQYSTNASYSGAKAVAIKNPNAVSKTIKGLAAKKYYYVRVRTYKTVGGVNYFSGWSKSLKVKTK